MNTSDYITIPLSKRSKKHAGLYETIVSIEDADLAELNWNVYVGTHTIYVNRRMYSNGKAVLIRLHRVVLERKLGYSIPDGMQVDHIDGNGLNNTRDNLRLATNAQNMWNQRKRVNNKSGYKGVQWYKSRQNWRAVIRVNGKRIHLGYFDTPEEAHQAYCDAAKELHGEFANFGDTPITIISESMGEFIKSGVPKYGDETPFTLSIDNVDFEAIIWWDDEFYVIGLVLTNTKNSLLAVMCMHDYIIQKWYEAVGIPDEIDVLKGFGYKMALIMPDNIARKLWRNGTLPDSLMLYSIATLPLPLSGK